MTILEVLELTGKILGAISAVVAFFLVTLPSGRRWLANTWLRFFPNRRVQIFGSKQSGKSTLHLYLRGKPTLPAPPVTYAATAVGRIVVDLSGNQTVFFRSSSMYDVGGEFHKLWEEIINEKNPDGIIYVVDTVMRP